MCKAFLSIIIVLNMLSLSAAAISAKSAILIDSNSGRILYEHNAYEKLPMASTTKIMTGLLSCESEKLEKSVKASPFASGTEGSSLWLKIGEKQTLENLTYGLMLKSGNDAAVAIAEYIGGSVDAFALLMNKKAREIGATSTNFENPHGLDSKEHYTTAYDLALIAREAMKNEKFREIVATKTYSIPMQGEPWDRAFKNHNKLLWNYEGCNGVKTGYTKKSGRCLVSSASKGNEELICVTLNAPQDWDDHTKLLNYGFDNFETITVFKKGSCVKTITYDKKYDRKVKILCDEDFLVSVNKNDVVTTRIKTNKIKYPAEKGSPAGYGYVYCNGKEIGKVTLVTEKEIKNITISERIRFLLKKVKVNFLQ